MEDRIVYEPNAIGDETYNLEYQFLTPVTLSIENSNGIIEVINYGIGENIFVLEPKVQTLQSYHNLRDKIPLADGRYIVEWPENIKTYNPQHYFS